MPGSALAVATNQASFNPRQHCVSKHTQVRTRVGPLQSPPMVSSGQTAIGDVKYLVADIAGSVEYAYLPPTGGGAGLALALGVVAVGGRQRVGSVLEDWQDSYPLFSCDCISLESDSPQNTVQSPSLEILSRLLVQSLELGMGEKIAMATCSITISLVSIVDPYSFKAYLLSRSIRQKSIPSASPLSPS